MPQPQPMLVQRPPLLHEPQRRKLQLLRLPPHDEMQHDRHRDKRRAAKQCWSDKTHRCNRSEQFTTEDTEITEKMQSNGRATR